MEDSGPVGEGALGQGEPDPAFAEPVRVDPERDGHGPKRYPTRLRAGSWAGQDQEPASGVASSGRQVSDGPWTTSQVTGAPSGVARSDSGNAW